MTGPSKGAYVLAAFARFQLKSVANQKLDAALKGVELGQTLRCCDGCVWLMFLATKLQPADVGKRANGINLMRPAARSTLPLS
jgi:hypothetical protein